MSSHRSVTADSGGLDKAQRLGEVKNDDALCQLTRLEMAGGSPAMNGLRGDTDDFSQRLRLEELRAGGGDCGLVGVFHYAYEQKRPAGNGQPSHDPINQEGRFLGLIFNLRYSHATKLGYVP